MKRPYGIALKSLASVLALSLVAGGALAQETTAPKPKTHKKATVRKTLGHPRQVRAVLSPSDFPISLTAFDRKSSDADSSGTVLEISKNGYKSFKPEALYTKDLDGEQISSVVSWNNTDRTHFGFLVLTTPSAGNLYSVMFFLYHDGKLSMPIDEIATGYPVFPTIKHTDKAGQIQIEMFDGNTAATNDKVRTLVVYTWSDWSKKFLKTSHRVAAASAERPRGKKIIKTDAASGN